MQAQANAPGHTCAYIPHTHTHSKQTNFTGWNPWWEPSAARRTLSGLMTSAIMMLPHSDSKPCLWLPSRTLTDSILSIGEGDQIFRGNRDSKAAVSLPSRVGFLRLHASDGRGWVIVGVGVALWDAPQHQEYHTLAMRSPGTVKCLLGELGGTKLSLTKSYPSA